MARAGPALILASLLVCVCACSGDLGRLDRLIEDGHYAEAEARARQLVTELDSNGTDDSLRAAQVLDRLVLALLRGGKAQQAEPLVLAERAVDLKEARLAPGDPELCESLDQLGWIVGSGGDADRGTGLLQRSLVIREEAFGEGSQEVSRTLNYLAPLLWDIGDYAAARPMYERALAIRRKSGSGIDGVLNNLGVLAYDMGDYASARRYYGEALQIRVADNPEHPRVPDTMINLAIVHWKEGALAEASRMATDALAMQQRLRPPDHESIGVAQFVMADIEVSLGRPRQALPRYEQAIQILGDAMGPDHPFLVRPLLGFAAALRQTTDLDAARQRIQRAVEISSRRLGADHPYTSSSRGQLAAVLLDEGDTDACLRMALVAEAGSRQHLRLTSRALAERQSLHYASVRNSGLDLALTLAARGLKPQELDQVFEAVIRSRALVLDEMAERHQLLARVSNPEIERLADELAVARTRLANLMVRGLSGDADRQASQIAGARQTVETAEMRLAQGSVPFRRQMETTEVGLDAVRRSLPPSSALVALARYRDHEPGSIEEPVLSYVALIHHGGASIAVPLAEADVIDALIERWREEVALESAAIELGPAEAEKAYRRIGTALRERVWDPIAAELDGADLVFVVPDGALNTVSLATLPTRDERYLIESGPRIHYLSAERDLVALVRWPATGSGMLAMGAPDFDTSLSVPAVRTDGFRGTRGACRAFETVVFAPLPQAESEIGEIARTWKSYSKQDIDVFTGSAANEAIFKRDAPGKRSIHVATHGFFLGSGCGNRSEGRRSIGLGGAGGPDAAVGNPFVLSGLAFAGANQRADAAEGEEDGVLTAEEITAMDLHSVEWVVLSACDTGLGEIRDGEGVLGLRRALQLAGARTLIMSLWSVDDAATRRFMTDLYRVRLLGATTVDSMRLAGLASLEERRQASESTHPFFWGAFVATGGWT